MERLRMKDGVSGFPRRCESEYDTFGVGHSSTSISAALGMAVAARNKGEERRVVAIIGDGAMSAGQAFEALNNAGVIDANLLVILNDNDMSISPPVGALNKYLARCCRAAPSMPRRAGEKVLAALPNVLEFANRVEEHVKGMISPGTLFEEFGFNYIGPIDGHDLDALIPTLQNLRKLKGPQFLHVITTQGPGLQAGRGRSDPLPRRRQVRCRQWHRAGQGRRQAHLHPGLRRLAVRPGQGGQPPGRHHTGDARRLGHGALRPGVSAALLRRRHRRAARGDLCRRPRLRRHAPVVAIYSTFLQRAYDQLIHDIALQNLPVVFAIDRGGLVGADGATHNGAFDLSYLSCIPNMVVMTPSDENECRQMLSTAYTLNSPSAVRYPRGSGPGTPWSRSLDAADRQGRVAPARQARGAAGLWLHAGAGTEGWPRRSMPASPTCASSSRWMPIWCASWPRITNSWSASRKMP
jgi:1-deoxy-D-xylulose-5-phosphate synthase